MLSILQKQLDDLITLSVEFAFVGTTNLDTVCALVNSYLNTLRNCLANFFTLSETEEVQKPKKGGHMRK